MKEKAIYLAAGPETAAPDAAWYLLGLLVIAVLLVVGTLAVGRKRDRDGPS